MNLIVFITFCTLLISTCFCEERLTLLIRKSIANWTLDISGLFIQGIVIPFFQTTLLYYTLLQFLPHWQDSLRLGPMWIFALHFISVDYLYYWNHRLLHGRLWHWHIVHHTAERLDVWVSSRNSLWTHFLIVYVWINALFLFLLENPAPYLLSVAITASLDLWRHSQVYPRRPNYIYRLFSKILITPHEHAWHHSNDKIDSNFGANLKIWDRLHGTGWSLSLIHI